MRWHHCRAQGALITGLDQLAHQIGGLGERDPIPATRLHHSGRTARSRWAWRQPAGVLGTELGTQTGESANQLNYQEKKWRRGESNPDERRENAKKIRGPWCAVRHALGVNWPPGGQFDFDAVTAHQRH